MSALWSHEEQAKRREELWGLHRKKLRDYFDENGRSITPGTPPDHRGRLYSCWTLLEGDESDREFADRILREAHGNAAVRLNGEFTALGAARLLRRYGARLEPWAKEMLAQLVEEESYTALSKDFASGHSNKPAMCTYNLLVGGGLLGKKEWVDAGRENLYFFADMMKRRAFATEFTSPTYSAITVSMMALISDEAKDSESRKLARKLEERCLVELLTRFHAPTCMLTGPHSRAYEKDSVGWKSLIHLFYWMLYGERVQPEPHLTWYIDPWKGSDPVGGKDKIAWNAVLHVPFITAATFHVPDWLGELGLEKRFPYRVRGTSELNVVCNGKFVNVSKKKREHWRFDLHRVRYPARAILSTTYMEEDYAVGSCTAAPGSTHHSDGFHVAYRRSKPGSAPQQRATVYSRYLVSKDRKDSAAAQVQDQGRFTSIQHDNTVLMLYRPLDIGETTRAARLELSLLFPRHFGQQRRLYIGGNRLKRWASARKGIAWVFVEDGDVVMAFHPLVDRTWHGGAAIRAKEVGNYQLLSFINYEGPKRTFSHRELCLTGNGFVAEIRSKKKGWTVKRLQKQATSSQLLDDTFMDVRSVRYAREGLELALAWDPFFEHTVYATINGGPRPEPILEADGLNAADLPFLGRDQATRGTENFRWIRGHANRIIPYYFQEAEAHAKKA